MLKEKLGKILKDSDLSTAEQIAVMGSFLMMTKIISGEIDEPKIANLFKEGYGTIAYTVLEGESVPDGIDIPDDDPDDPHYEEIWDARNNHGQGA